MNTQPSSSWQQRHLSDADKLKALNFMASVCEAAGSLPKSESSLGQSHASAEKTFHKSSEVTSVGGLRLSSIRAMETYLTEWFGTPTAHREVSEGGELQGLHLAYANGITVNYLLHRANGISFTLPKAASTSLASHVVEGKNQLHSPEAEIKSQSPIAR